MKRSKFTEEQIAFALHQADTDTSVEEFCRQNKFPSLTTFRQYNHNALNFSMDTSIHDCVELKCILRIELNQLLNRS